MKNSGFFRSSCYIFIEEILEETKNKISKAKIGNTATKDMHWYNNGKINIMAYECQDGFVPGRISWKK